MESKLLKGKEWETLKRNMAGKRDERKVCKKGKDRKKMG
jgi:hypothetical protein